MNVIITNHPAQALPNLYVYAPFSPFTLQEFGLINSWLY